MVDDIIELLKFVLKVMHGFLNPVLILCFHVIVILVKITSERSRVYNNKSTLLILYILYIFCNLIKGLIFKANQ